MVDRNELTARFAKGRRVLFGQTQRTRREGGLIETGDVALLGHGEDMERTRGAVRGSGAANSRTSPERQVNVLCAALAVTLGITLLISARLWLSARDYPLVPVWPGLPRVPPP